jgi:hypothetical protein
MFSCTEQTASAIKDVFGESPKICVLFQVEIHQERLIRKSFSAVFALISLYHSECVGFVFPDFL